MPELVRPEPPAASAIATLPPGYFALVMATGIVSLSAHFLALELVAQTLLWINVAAYGVLWVLTLVRIARHARRVAADLADHARGPGFFTLPAATCVLGVQVAILCGRTDVAALLWLFGLALWAVVTYGFFAAVTAKGRKPSLAEGLNGTWLVAVVSMQSIAVLACLVAPELGPPGRVLLVGTAMHMGGFMLYLPLIGLLLYRWTFVDLPPQQLTPPYWINMGALAISTLAGARLLQAADGLPLLQRITPFLEGATFFFWTAATWWIPLLVVLGAWRHGIRRVPLRYDPQYWGMVFPLGMYTTCTYQMARALDLPEIVVVARVFVWFALAAWLAAFTGLVATLARAAGRA